MILFPRACGVKDGSTQQAWFPVEHPTEESRQQVRATGKPGSCCVRSL